MEVEEEVACFVPAQHLLFKHLGAVAVREGRKREKRVRQCKISLMLR